MAYPHRFYRLLGLLCMMGGIGLLVPSPPLVAQTLGAQTLIAQSQSNTQELRQLLRDARENIEAGQYQEAIALYTRATQLDRENPQIFSGIGYSYSQLGQFAAAAAAFRQAVALDRRNVDFQYGLALSLQKAGDYQGAISAYQALIQLDNRPQNRNRTNTYLGLGQAFASAGDLAAALRTYQQLISLDPKEARAYDAAGEILVKQQRFEEALPLFQKALELVPNTPGTYINLGITWVGLRNPQRGIEAFEQARRLNPRNPDVYFKLGEIFYQTGQPEEALEIYHQVLRLDPEQAAPRQRMVEILLAQPDYLRAIVNARLWVDRLPSDPNAYRYLGLALQGRNRPQEARTAWAAAKSLYQQQGNLQGVREIEGLEQSLR
ncbi:MAG: tetratricopeptide repeat protein [Prochlorotrichaceae cyanobacterium]